MIGWPVTDSQQSPDFSGMIVKGCVWLVLGALLVIAILLCAILLRTSTVWCHSNSIVGECIYFRQSEACYCIETFRDDNSVKNEYLNIYNASNAHCQLLHGNLAAVQTTELLRTLAKRMYKMVIAANVQSDHQSLKLQGVENTIVALRKIDMKWFWMKSDGEMEEYNTITWRPEFPSQPQHKQAMISVETWKVKVESDHCNYEWKYYYYGLDSDYLDSEENNQWFGFTTTDDLFNEHAYMICEYGQDPCYCPIQEKIELSHAGETTTFQTPGYPSNYCSDNSCRWMITVPEGLAIHIDWVVFSLENNMDFAYIFEGHQHDSPLLKRCTGVKCSDTRSSGHELQVHFMADHVTTDIGIKARVTVVGTDPCYCAQHMTVDLLNMLDSLTFESPKYPYPYCTNHNCTWTVTCPVNLGMKISFEHFGLEVERDYLRFVDHDGERECTGMACDDVQTEEKVNINFLSDPNQSNDMGFRGTVTVIANYCEKLDNITDSHVKNVTYSDLRSDGNVPIRAIATLTCNDNYKADGSYDVTTNIIQCESEPTVKWSKQLEHICVPVCSLNKLPVTEDDHEDVHLCPAPYEDDQMVQVGHSITVQHYNYKDNKMLPKSETFTCRDDHHWTPNEIKCHEDLKILLIGGSDLTDHPSELIEQEQLVTYFPHKPRSNTVLPVKMEQPRLGANSAVLSDGSVFIVGGHDNFDKYNCEFSSCERYFPETDDITDCPALQTARKRAASAMFNGHREMDMRLL